MRMMTIRTINDGSDANNDGDNNDDDVDSRRTRKGGGGIFDIRKLT